MPPRYAYWTILAGGLPTAFRAAEKDELLPTFKRIQEKQPDAEMKFFARGKLWDTPEQALRAEAGPRGHGPERPEGDPGMRGPRSGGDAPRERRSRDWRPGGEHRDPRQPFKDAKKARNQDQRQERWDRKNAPPRERPHGDPMREEIRPRGSGGYQGKPYDRPQGRPSDRPQGKPTDRPQSRPQGRPFDRPQGQGRPFDKSHGRPSGTAPGRAPKRDWKERPPDQDWRSRPPKPEWRVRPPKENWQDRPPKQNWQDRPPKPEWRDRPPNPEWRKGDRKSSGATTRRPFDSRSRGSSDPRSGGPSDRGNWSTKPPRTKPHGDKFGARPFRPKTGTAQEPPPPPRPRGPNREPRPGQEPPPEPPPRPSETTIPPPGPPERGAGSNKGGKLVRRPRRDEG